MRPTSEHENAALALEGVTVRYGRTTALHGATLAVGAGEVVALLGRNGAGKTSLIRCLLGQRKADGGRASLFGEDAFTHRARLMSRVGVVPETPDAPADMSPSALLDFCSRVYPTWDGREAESRLGRFGVPVKTPFGRLSKGQKGHVALALALAHRPDLLVLDDPTLGLDAVARKDFFEELIGDLSDRGTTVFLASHDLSGVEAVADRAAFLKDGRLVLDERLDDLKARFRRIAFDAAGEEARKALDAVAPLPPRLGAFGEEAVASRFSEEAFARFASAPGVAGAQAEPMNLESIFLAVCGEAGGAS
jgi:ABC-2 type transport system ATP-binding protein